MKNEMKADNIEYIDTHTETWYLENKLINWMPETQTDLMENVDKYGVLTQYAHW